MPGKDLHGLVPFGANLKPPRRAQKKEVLRMHNGVLVLQNSASELNNGLPVVRSELDAAWSLRIAFLHVTSKAPKKERQPAA
jgi:hypothetical protein